MYNLSLTLEPNNFSKVVYIEGNKPDVSYPTKRKQQS